MSHRRLQSPVSLLSTTAHARFHIKFSDNEKNEISGKNFPAQGPLWVQELLAFQAFQESFKSQDSPTKIFQAWGNRALYA